MSARLRGMAQETERIVAAGAYRAPGGRLVEIAAAVGRARSGTRLLQRPGDPLPRCPGVPVFRDDRGTLLGEPYEAGFLTAAAPNAGVIARQRPAESGRVAAALAVRAERVLEVAAAGGHRQLVLGAWGCGVFRNEPADVAGAFAAALLDGGRFDGWFDRVVFAVLDRRADSPTRAAFAAEFSGVSDASGSVEPR